MRSRFGIIRVKDQEKTMTKNYREFRTTVGGRELIVETGKYAEQTNGSCVLRCGDTAVMVNVTMA